MESEKNYAKSEAEKKAIDTSGHSELQIDRKLNQGVTNQQTIGIFTSKKKEKVLLENK